VRLATITEVIILKQGNKYALGTFVAIIQAIEEGIVN
jgi:hypothetical protein